MGIIYVNGGYISSSTVQQQQITVTNEQQDIRIERIEQMLDGSGGTVDNPEVLNAMIKENTEKITTNISEIQSLGNKLENVEQVINNNTITINNITMSLDAINKSINDNMNSVNNALNNISNNFNEKIDNLNKKIDNLDTSGLSWIEVQNTNN